MKVRLGDYINEYSVRNKANEDIPVYSVTNTQGFCRDYFGKEVASKDKTTYKIVPKGCFAYNPSRINVGSVDWQRTEDKVIVSPLYNVFCVSDEINKQYLYYYLKSDITLQRIKTVATGSVRDNLKLDMLAEFPIELPDKKEQSLIVDILDKTKQVIALRKKELDALDNLTKARFVELFGNPIKNEKHWDIFKLGECLKSIDNGKSFTCNVRTRTDEHPAILKLSAVTYGDYRPEENKVLLDEKQFIDSAEVHSGDLLFTRKNTPELVGMAAYVHKTPAHLMMPDLIFRLVPNERMTAIFLWQLINNQEFRPVIQSIAGGSAKSMSNISKERLSNISVICPPIDEQIRLNEIIHKIDKSKILSETHIFYAEKSITPTTPKIFLKGRCIYGNEF